LRLLDILLEERTYVRILRTYLFLAGLLAVTVLEHYWLTLNGSGKGNGIKMLVKAEHRMERHRYGKQMSVLSEPDCILYSIQY